MPNHFRLLLRQETDEPLSKFMQVLLNAYVQGLILEQERGGTLFEERFQQIGILSRIIFRKWKNIESLSMMWTMRKRVMTKSASICLIGTNVPKV